MTKTRNHRISAFDRFRESSKELFASLSNSDPNAKHLDDLYSLCICPGGRNGGLSKTIVEVFYGNRPIDSEVKIDENARLTEKLVVAHGATLGYLRNDNGQVICNLYPAASENQRPIEDAILLDFVRDPHTLQHRARRHWRYFVAYMEATSLDGDPSVVQRARVFYLRYFKQHIIDAKVHDSRAVVVARDVSKWVLTVGLSGFLIFIASSAISMRQAEEELTYRMEATQASAATAQSLSDISNQLTEISGKLDEFRSLVSHATDALNEMRDRTEPEAPVDQPKEGER